jgi:hypothetical protein
MSYYVNNSSNTLTMGNISLIGGTAAPTWNTASVYTIGASNGTYSTLNQSVSVNINDKGITMKEEADIVIGGKSIKSMLETIESRLAILHPNKDIESEWEELKRLGDEYRALEKEIKEKMKTWDILKKDN